jgi:chaperone BCS1
MHTVSLDQQQKAQIILDVNEYLQSNTAQWYASRGIPYRRDYLLHGPPGSGKTFRSFALTGLFRLSVNCVSLSEVGLSEAHLATLFNHLSK